MKEDPTLLYDRMTSYFLAIRESLVFFYQWINPYFLGYYSAINVVYVLLLFLGIIKVYRRRKEVSVEDLTSVVKSNSFSEISFLLPIYNNASEAVRVIHNLLGLSYRYKRLILINDGSTDKSLSFLIEKLDFLPIPKFYEEKLPTKPIRGVYQSKTYPEIILIDKENGRKFDALNAGINASEDPFFISVDPDTFIDNKEFEALIRPILFYPDVIGVGASVRIRNGCTLNFNRISTVEFPKDFLPAIQSVEYLRAFLQREGWDYLGGNVCLSGAFSVYKKEAIIKVGGYVDTIAEDMEMVVRLHRVFKKNKTPYKIVYLPDPVAWTEGPSTLKTLGRQRTNWHRGLLEVLWLHKALFFNPRYGFFGLFNMPFWVWGEALEPLVEALGYFVIILGLVLGISNTVFVFLFLLLVWGYNILFTVFCILIEDFGFKKYQSLRTILLLSLSAVAENFGYKQMTILWRLRGFKDFFKKLTLVRKTGKNLKILLKKAYKEYFF